MSFRPGALAGIACLACSELHGPPAASGPAPAAPTVPALEAVASAAAAPAAAHSLAAAPAAPAPPPPEHEQADLDPTNDLLVAPPEPIDDCEGRLARAGIGFRAAVLPLQRENLARHGRADIYSCGAEQVVTYLGGPAKIRYNIAPLLTCRLALALARFEQLAQEQATQHLGRRIVGFTQLGTYNCRKMVRFDFISEHSYANAIDIKDFRLDNGQRVSVKAHFGALEAPPATPRARFLRSLAERAFDERLFSVVLTPYWDKLHNDHFHLDLARYHIDGTRP